MKKLDREYEYTLSLSSYFPHSEAAFYDFLKCKTLKDLIFPARSPVSSWEKIINISSINDVKSRDLIGEQSSGSDFCLYLYGDSGVDLVIRVIVESILGSSNLVVKFCKQENAFHSLGIELIENLLSELVPVFRPYYASAYSKTTGSTYLPSGQPKYFMDKLSKRRYPLHVCWVSYFGIDMLDFLSVERFDRLETYYKKYELFQGILVVLQKDSPLVNISSYQQRRDQAEMELGFLELLNGKP